MLRSIITGWSEVEVFLPYDGALYFLFTDVADLQAVDRATGGRKTSYMGETKVNAA